MNMNPGQLPTYKSLFSVLRTQTTSLHFSNVCMTETLDMKPTIRLLLSLVCTGLVFIICGCATLETVKYVQEGHRYVSTGQYDKALSSYEQTLKEAPGSINGEYFVAAAEGNIGATYMMLGQYDSAMEYYNKSLQSAERIKVKSSQMEVYASIYNNIVSLYLFKREKYKDALVFCEDRKSVV